MNKFIDKMFDPTFNGNPKSIPKILYTREWRYEEVAAQRARSIQTEWWMDAAQRAVFNRFSAVANTQQRNPRIYSTQIAAIFSASTQAVFRWSYSHTKTISGSYISNTSYSLLHAIYIIILQHISIIQLQIYLHAGSGWVYVRYHLSHKSQLQLQHATVFNGMSISLQCAASKVYQGIYTLSSPHIISGVQLIISVLHAISQVFSTVVLRKIGFPNR